jgi:hypothetical protein
VNYNNTNTKVPSATCPKYGADLTIMVKKYIIKMSVGNYGEDDYK